MITCIFIFVDGTVPYLSLDSVQTQLLADCRLLQLSSCRSECLRAFVCVFCCCCCFEQKRRILCLARESDGERQAWMVWKQVWRQKDIMPTPMDGEGTIPFCLFWSPQVPTTHTVSTGQRGWSRARNQRTQFSSTGLWEPDGKHSTGLVIESAFPPPLGFTLNALLQPYPGQPYAQCVVLKKHILYIKKALC